MARRHVGWIVFNAALIILAACVAGLPAAEALKASEGLPTLYDVPGGTHEWNLVHSEGLINAILMLATAGATTTLALADRTSRVLCWALVVMGWGNFLGALFAALGSDTVAAISMTNNPASFIAFIPAALGAVIAVVLLAHAGLVCGRGREMSASVGAGD